MRDDIDKDNLPEDENLPENSNENQGAEDESVNEDENGGHGEEKIIPLSGMYENWFLDYASYVIMERAVPSMGDGLKPVQRRIFHSMKELDDGRYNKVANVIGNTMKYHPHGDASIGDAMVGLGQKDIMIDMQGNWGNTLTGDRAAAPRYIEARLSKFANHVGFNPKTTEWLASYDGRNKEPEHLPMKFPLLLAQGAEGIAVGMACKILPHNFIELIDASVDILRGKKPQILPDFLHGGEADFSNYNDGLRGGKVRVRAKIRVEDKKTIVISEIPFGTTTSSLIESIVKANDKGKFKIKKIEDNTAAVAEILIHLPAGVSPDKTVDALYAFSDCEVSISPNCAVIDGKKPVFVGVSEVLRRSTERSVELLKMELQIRLGELEEQWHFSSLEKIFIENRIYRDIEEEETWEGVISAITKGLKPHVKHLKRKVTEEDVVRLTEIRIKRISKFDSFKADEIINRLEDEIKKVQYNLDNLIEFAIDYFKDLKKRFSEGKERKTEIKVFDNISAKKVIVANKKLYVNREEGFVGWSLKKDEFISECSEIDDVILFFDTGKMMVTRIADKKFVGKGIIHCGIWKKGDVRTIYHMIYQDGKAGAAMMKRFAVNSITREKEYDLTKGSKGSKVLYFTANPNGEKEIVSVQLRPRPHIKKLKFDIDFSELLIKGRGASGNRVTKEIISKVIQKEVGGSTLAARKVWFDDVVKRLNDEGRGRLLGAFKGDDKILTVYQSGQYRLTNFDLTNRFDDDLILIEKWVPDHPVNAVYYDGEKELHFVKRFLCEVTSDKKVLFITEDEHSHLDAVSTAFNPRILISYNKHLKATKNLPDKEVELKEVIDVKGMKAQGNQLTKLKVKSIELMKVREEDKWPAVEEEIEKEEEVVVDTDHEINGESNSGENLENSEVLGSTKTDDSVTMELSVEKEVSGKEIPNDDGDEEEDQMSMF